MLMFLTGMMILSWRNVWRNRRRSLITAASVVVAVFFIVLMESLNRGMSDYLIDNEIRLYTAHIEVNHRDFSRQRSTEHAMAGADTLIPWLSGLPGVSGVSMRMELLVLAASNGQTMPAIVWGMEQDAPGGFFDYAGMVGQGSAEPGQLVVGGELAAELGIVPGDSLVLIGQSYRGRIAAGIYRVSGIAGIPVPDVSRYVVFAPAELVGELADIPGGATALLVNLRDKEEAEQVSGIITAGTSHLPLKARTWQEIMSGRLATSRLRETGISVMKVILYVLLGFGILGAMLLTHFERRREYRMLMALGMKPRRLAATLVLEMALTGGFGLLAGLALIVPIVMALHRFPIRVTGKLAEIMMQFNVEPLLMMSTRPQIFSQSALTVLLITLSIAAATTLPAVWLYRKK